MVKMKDWVRLRTKIRVRLMRRDVDVEAVLKANVRRVALVEVGR